jgi:intracellular multiplication protein IcmO
MAYAQRGLERSQEQKMSAVLRDTRSFGERISGILKNPIQIAVALSVIGASALVFPVISDILLLVCIFVFTCSAVQKCTLPYRMPMRSHAKDYNDLIPGTHKPKQAQGIYFFGNEKKTNSEIWFSNEDMRTHVLIFGSTGSGKTETLVSLAYNALLHSSGFIYVDGKGDNSLYAKVFGMVKYMGREDDLLLINFMTGAKDIVGPQEHRLSNTLNPFADGSSGMLSNLVVSMMDSGSSSGDSDMWKGRAIAFVEALMKVLTAMRDAGHILLDANTIRNYFGLDRLEAMVTDSAFIRDGQYPIDMSFLPDNVMEPMRNYVYNLPGYNKDKKGKQVSQVFEQHGFITMQLVRVFSSLADTYGHIIRTNLAEVDLRDVVLNRRIMVVLLPALEKSPDELANLGKIIIATMKAMMASGLGESVEGDYRDLIDRKPTNAETPFLCILDEYGYYAVKGFAVVPAQARSLGFSVIFAGQDLPAFQKASKEEAASIGANTNIKICMKLEDPTETWDFFNKSAGESLVTQVESFQSNAGSISNAYQDTKGARVEKRSRIDLQDLKEQDVGEAHMFFKSRITRYRSFYAAPKGSKAMRLNQFLKVELPKDNDLYTLVKGIEDFDTLTKSISVKSLESTIPAGLTNLFEFHSKESPEITPIDRGLNSFIKFYDAQESGDIEFDAVEGEASEKQLSGVTIFNRVTIPDYLSDLIVKDRFNSDALIARKSLESSLNYLFRLLSLDDSEAGTLTEDIVKDISRVTNYSRDDIGELPDLVSIVSKLDSLIEEIPLSSE